MSAEKETSAAMLKASRAHTAKITQSGWRPAWKNPLDYFMWCVFEREVSKCPHVTLTSLKVMTSAVVTDLDREVIIHNSMKFQSWIEVVMEATGVFIKEMFILYAYKLFLKFSLKYIHPNYFFYCFECCHRVCPNLSSAPCIWGGR